MKIAGAIRPLDLHVSNFGHRRRVTLQVENKSLDVATVSFHMDLDASVAHVANIAHYLMADRKVVEERPESDALNDSVEV